MAITNRLFDELSPGDSARVQRICSEHDLYIFAHASGCLDPLARPMPDASGRPAGAPPAPLAPAMWLGALISQVVGQRLPGPGAEFRAQSLTFHRPVAVGDRLEVVVTVLEKRPPDLLLLETVIRLASGERVADGVAEVLAPRWRESLEEREAPELLVQRHAHAERLMAACAPLPPLRTAVAWPLDAPSLEGALRAGAERLIEPILVGEEAPIRALATAQGWPLEGVQIVPAGDPAQAARAAVALAREGRAGALMKGSLHTDVLLGAVVERESGLRTGRRASHVFLMDTPGIAYPLFISDAAIHIAPTLMEKADIIRNAIDLARACGLEQPRVGVLSAIETINPAIPSTLDAAVLAKMAERGQITGGLVDGPLAMDNAIDIGAARTKGIASLVAGRAQVLIAPNLEAGNMLAKELSFVAHAQAAGLVLGAKVPVMLTSRSDTVPARLLSCALAVLHDHWRRTGRSAVADA